MVVNEPSPLMLEITSSTDITCFGGADGVITVTAGGGIPGYTYSIDGVAFGASATFTGLIAGSHTITVNDANGCEMDLTVSLLQAPAVTVD